MSRFFSRSTPAAAAPSALTSPAAAAVSNKVITSPTPIVSTPASNVPCLVFMRAAFGDKPSDQTERATKWIVNELGATELISTRIYFHGHFISADKAKQALTRSQASSQQYQPSGSPCLQKNCGQQRHSVEGRIKKAGLDYSDVRRWILANKRVVLYDEVFRDMGEKKENDSANNNNKITTPSSSSSIPSPSSATSSDRVGPLPADVRKKMTMKQKELGFADLPPSEQHLPEHQIPDDISSKTPSARSSPAGSIILPTTPAAVSIAQQQPSSNTTAVPSLPSTPSSISSSTVSPLSVSPAASAVPSMIKKSPALKVYVKSRQGSSWDPHKVNQDRPLACVPLRGHPGVHVYGVLDGHGQNGHYVSEYVMHQLPAFLSAEKSLRTDMENAMISAVHNVVQELSNSNINLAFSGTTLCFGIHTGDQLYVANIGDSRCIIGRMDPNTNNRNSPIIIPLSRDHKPDSPGEMERIVGAGGRVCPIPGMQSGPNRVWLADLDEPGLAMSRSIGDEVSASVGVIATPEIRQHNILENDICAIFASDGIWEFLSNDDVMKIIFRHLDQPAVAVNQLVAESVRRWQEDCDGIIDDITVVLVMFK